MNTAQAKELGTKLIHLATEIDGLTDFKNNLESEELELALSKKSMPSNLKMAAFLNDEDTQAVKDFTINLIGKKIKAQEKQLDQLIPRQGA